VPSWRVMTLITPLIASDPYSAEPWGPRITSTRSTASGLSCVTRSGFATSIPSMYIFGKLVEKELAPRTPPYWATRLPDDCAQSHKPGTYVSSAEARSV
jgi:hypothetical protein